MPTRPLLCLIRSGLCANKALVVEIGRSRIGMAAVVGAARDAPATPWTLPEEGAVSGSAREGSAYGWARRKHSRSRRRLRRAAPTEEEHLAVWGAEGAAGVSVRRRRQEAVAGGGDREGRRRRRRRSSQAQTGRAAAAEGGVSAGAGQGGEDGMVQRPLHLPTVRAQHHAKVVIAYKQ